MKRATVAVAIRAALLTAEPRAKVMAARAVARDWRLGRLAFAFDVAMPDRPARPALPELLPPNRMPRRGRGGSEKGRIALWHSLDKFRDVLRTVTEIGVQVHDELKTIVDRVSKTRKSRCAKSLFSSAVQNLNARVRGGKLVAQPTSSIG